MEQLHRNICCFLPTSSIEEEAKQQLINVAELPFIYKHVAVMPDCHAGKGATVGSVIATKGAIIPAAVGVDIGCGMIAVKTKFTATDLPDSLQLLREGIERRIPVSAGKYNTVLHDSAAVRSSHLEKQAIGQGLILEKYQSSWAKQLGTLGSGNHFIEICLDESDRVWVVLHSGSRGIGNILATKHIALAKKLLAEKQIILKDEDLAYLTEGDRSFDEYMRDLHWAQEFALLNREEMMDRVLTELSYLFYGDHFHQQEIEIERINCHHNFTQRESHFGEDVWITRKGAIQMQQGQLGVIPGSMGTRSYVVEGLAHPMSFHSAPHGAGRKMSRTKAKQQFTLSDLEASMKGIEYKASIDFIDEIPAAYKDIDEVMEHSKELVSIRHVLRQIVNVKGK